MLGKKKAEADRKREFRQRKEAEAKLAELGGRNVPKIDDFDPGQGQSVPYLSHGTDSGQTSQSSVGDDTGTRTGTG
jgi:hypothetical protein